MSAIESMQPSSCSARVPSATWVIGDVQGCLSTLQRLLETIQFDRHSDRLVFAGDLVNRGPHSLATLRYIRGLDADVVLGNHDLHCLAVYSGHRKLGRTDTLDELINADDSADLMDWLRRKSMMMQINHFVITHAGCPAQWPLETLNYQSNAIEQILRADDWKETISTLFGNQPDQWLHATSRAERNLFTINALTRMRYVDRDGTLDFASKEGQAPATSQLIPWFAMPGHRVLSHPGIRGIIFGHWSTLGVFDSVYDTSLKFDNAEVARVIGLDGGCVWGGTLAAFQVQGPQMGKLVRSNCVEH